MVLFKIISFYIDEKQPPPSELSTYRFLHIKIQNQEHTFQGIWQKISKNIFA